MEWKDLVIQNFDISLVGMERTLQGLTQEDLNWQPKSDCNSIGWITWHVSRLLDFASAFFTGEEQLWIKDGWCSRFGQPADPEDRDGRHTPEQVAAFKSPDADTLIAYYQVVLKKFKKYLSTVSSSDLEQKFDDNWSQIVPTLGSRINVVVCETQQHLGQIGYIRGQLQGHEWVK